jgi:hypothetical protein
MNEMEATIIVESLEIEGFTLFRFPTKKAYACGPIVSVPAFLVRHVAEDDQVILCEKLGAWAAIRFTMGYAVLGESVMMTPRSVYSIYHIASACKVYRDLWNDGFYTFTIGDVTYTYRVGEKWENAEDLAARHH